MKKTIFLLSTLLFCNLLSAQDFNLGAEVVSRYIWRGTDFGNSPAIQPSIFYSSGSFEIGSWASYAISPVSAGADEHDFWVGYSQGSFSVNITDYYFPFGANFFNFEGDGNGAHFIEAGASLSGGDDFPIDLSAAAFFHNDVDNSIYSELTYHVNDQVDFSLSAGNGMYVAGGFYTTEGFQIVGIGFTVSKEIKLTESFSLPLFGTIILNPNSEKSFLVFGFSL